jgi:hypothetical protein
MKMLGANPCFLKKVAANGGEDDPGAATLEYLGADPSLEKLYSAGKRRLVDPDGESRATERSVLRGKVGITKVSQVKREIGHYRPSASTSRWAT